MLSDPTGKNSVVSAYDNVAIDYDSQLEQAHWVRGLLWERMDILFPAKSYILDVTAGTGLDILHLTERNVSVIACDISPGMLNRLHEKNPLVKSFVADFNHLGIKAQFDGVISTFAGLNTSADLRSFASCAAQLLRPGGTLFIHLLNRWPLLNIMQQFFKLRWSEVWNSLASRSREVNIGGVAVTHYLYSPLFLYHSVFANQFLLSRIESQGIVRPLNARQGKQLKMLERSLSNRFPFYAFGVFFSLELIRRNE